MTGPSDRLDVTMPMSPSLTAPAPLAEAFLHAFLVLMMRFPNTGGRSYLRLGAEEMPHRADVSDEELTDSLNATMAGGLASLLEHRCIGLDMAGRLAILMQVVDARSDVVHPSTTTRVRTSFSATGSPEFDLWQDRYDADGAFARVQVRIASRVETYDLVPRGPLRSSDLKRLDERGGSVQDLFSYLCVVGPRGRWGMKRVRNRTRSGWIGPGAGMSGAVISAVPVCTAPHEVEFEVSDNRIRPNPSQSIDMKILTKDVLDEAHVDGAGMVVFPEFVAGIHVAEPLSRHLGKAAAAGISRPHLWICGSALTSDGTETRNRCIVLDGDGRAVGIPQDKMNLNHVDARTLGNWVQRAAPRPGGFHEDFVCGQDILIIDDECWGRVVILICEDLKQADPSILLCRDLRPDWIVAPILDGSIHDRNHWAEDAALGLVTQSERHSRVLVVNSLSLTLREKPGLDPVPFVIAVDGWTLRLARTPAQKTRSKKRSWRPRARIVTFPQSNRRTMRVNWDPNEREWEIL